ncbi:MAG: protein of unknown function DUF859 [Bacteriophage sp.]|nr:MAG: protein of unknown function DUF859 [Bacteriophage sp.]
MSVNQTLTLEQIGQSITNNTSKVRIKWTSQQTGSSYNNAPGDKAYYYITINGGTETEHTVAFTLPQNTTKTILDTTLTVSHKADGTGSIKVRTWMDTEISAGVITQTKTLTLDTIPRASAVSAPSTGTLGTALKITIDRKSASFTDKLYYKIGSNSAVQITEYDGTAGTYSWTPPVSLAINAPNSTKLAVTLIANTYNGTAYVGRSECTVTLTIPSSVAPTLSVSVTDPTGNKSKYTGYFLQLRSKIKVAITGTGAQGSTIKSYSIKVGWSAGSGTLYTASAATGTTGFLPYYGTVYITCAVTDSRGRTATKSLSYTVSKYSVPTILSISATRCTQNGTANRTGEYGKVTFTAAITALSNKNTAAYKVQYREYGTEAWTSVTPTIPEADKYAPKNITTIFPADTNKRYTVRVVATDAFSTSNSSMRDISASFVLQHLAKSKSSVGIGRLCDDDKTKAFQVGLDAYFDKSIYADRFVYMGGYKKSDTEKDIYFQTTEGAANPHNTAIYGGNGESAAAWGVYDAQNKRSVIRYDDAAGTLTLLGLGPTNLTIGASGSNLKGFSGMAKYSAMMGLGILRVSGETNVSLTADTTYDIADISDHRPTSTYALSVYCQKSLDARLTTSGTIQIRPKEAIAAGYYIYIAGIWIAS